MWTLSELPPFRVERSYCMKVRSGLPHSAAKHLPKHPSNLPNPSQPHHTTPQFVQDQKLRHAGNTRPVLCTWLTQSKYEDRIPDTSPQTHMPASSALAPCKPKIGLTLTPPNFCTSTSQENPRQSKSNKHRKPRRDSPPHPFVQRLTQCECQRTPTANSRSPSASLGPLLPWAQL
jgi:hypothetical protein